MKTICIFLAEGFEEMEAMFPLDVMRRGGLNVKTVSVTGEKTVVSSHQVPIVADMQKYDLKELKDMIGFGGSPRASINLALAARTYAFIKRRGYVIPEDVRAVAHDVLRHRIGLTYEAEASNLTSDEIISKILNKVEVP